MIEKSIPTSLRYWFIVHFVIDTVFAIPLLFFTGWFLAKLNFPDENLIFIRLVGAILLGIGGSSLFSHNAGRETMQAMLVLKLLWSGGAIFAISLSLYQGAPAIAWIFLGIFLLFFLVWSFYFFGYKKCKLYECTKTSANQSS